MVFDDDFSDNEEQATAPQAVPVAGLASNAAPRHAPGLDQGREALTCPADVSFQRKWALRDILEKPMRIHLQGTGRYTTPNQRDVEKLVGVCFEDGQWKTGQYHNLPSPKDLNAEVQNVCVVIGTLSQDLGAVSHERANNMPARKEITHRVINHGETTKITKKCPKKQEIGAHRKAGSRVLIGIVKGADNSFTFKYYDGAHRLLPNSYRPENLAGDLRTIDEAKLAAMRAYEKYWMERGLKYNMEVARYIARNRLTFWANGGHYDQVPKEEEKLMKCFVPYKLIRNMYGPSNVSALIDQVKAIPLPPLFSCF